MQRARAASPKRAAGSRTGGSATRNGSSSAGPQRGVSADPATLIAQGAEPTVDELLDLQRDAGNRAVSALVTTAQPAAQRQLAVAEPAAPEIRTPSDIELGFNALDISHRLIEAIDQSELKQVSGSFGPGSPQRPGFVRHVDFAAVHAHLSGLTAEQVRLVEQRYQQYEGRPLYVDLFGGGQSGFPTDLTVEQVYRLKALLQGTRATSPADAEAAARHQREADVAELRSILKGKPGPGEVERVMTLLRRPREEAELLAREYDANWDLRTDLFRLAPLDAMRATMLLEGWPGAADLFAVMGARSRIVAIDEEIARLTPPPELSFTTVAIASAEAMNPAAAYQRRQRLAALKAERKRHVETIETRVRIAADEARDEALAEGRDVLEVDAAVRGRVEAVLGDPAGIATLVGGTKGALIAAMAREDVPHVVAAELRSLYEAGKLTSQALTRAFRELREKAELEAQRRYPSATADELEAETKRLADQWFIRLRDAWDASAGEGRTFSQILDRGSQTDVDAARGLYMASGKLSDADELVLALAGGRKDLETVKRVLRDKTADRIAELREQYREKTRSPAQPNGRSLDTDLFGVAPTRAGQGSAIAIFAGGTVVAGGVVGGQELLGKASGTDRLVLEDYLQRPQREGGLEEVEYVVGRAEREYEYTIANRGATGWWRDHWGNEARSLLDATRREVHRLRARWLALTNHGANAEAVRSAEAHELIHAMHLARATIRGDRAGYERATAALRAKFQMVASFVLQAVLTAVLTPFATAIFAARLAQAGATVARFAAWTKNTAVGIASTISANKAVYGNDYTTEMLLKDLRGGLAGAIGATGVEKLLGPVAGRLQDRLGTTMGGEVIAGAKTVGSMEATAIVEGEDARIFENFLEAHFLSRAGEAITAGTTKALGLETPTAPGAPKAAAGGEGEGPVRPAGGEEGPVRTPDVELEAPVRVPMALPEAEPVPVRDKGRSPVADPDEAIRRTSEEADDFLGADESATAPPERRPDETMVGIGEIGPGRPGHYTTSGERAKQQRRAAQHPSHGRLIEQTARPDARARRRAAEFAALDREWAALRPVGRLARIREILNAHLVGLGVPEVRMRYATDVAPGNARFDFENWTVTLSRETIHSAELSPDQFARLVSNAVHEGRHALHHFRGMRAALYEGRFDPALKVPDRVKEAVRVANANATVGTELDRAFRRGDPDAGTEPSPAYGEGLSVYDQTHGEGKQRRRAVIRERNEARRAVEEAAARLDAATDRAARAQARAELRAARLRYRRAHNEYVALPQEIDAWRYGKATQAAVAERVRVERGLRKMQPRADVAEREYRDARRRYLRVRSEGGDVAEAYREYRAAQGRWYRLRRSIRTLEKRLAALEPPAA